MQKPKSKNKLKPRDLNRKGAEKEGTDMDAFVNAVPPTKTDNKQENKQENKESLPPKDSNKESSNVITKEIKEKDNYESKKEKEIIPVHTKTEKHVTPLAPEVSRESTPVPTPVIEKLPASNKETLKETLKEASPTIEDNSKSNACNIQAKSVPNDVVDHAEVKEDIDLEPLSPNIEKPPMVQAPRIVVEENQTPPPPPPPDTDNKYENEPAAQTETAASAAPSSLKYSYKDDQWSPINKSGKKVYDREFLMKLQYDPNSKVKPSNLPDLEVVLKDGTKARSMVDLRPFKDPGGVSRHDIMLPGFVKSALNTRMLPSNRKSHPGKPKPSKSNVIHVSLSLREDVKLRETENAWRPTRFKPGSHTEEDTKTEALYKKFRSVLNKLTPQKFNTLLEQVRALTIDTEERLEGVINLVFEKAVDEPSFSVAYALMCKELGKIEVANPDGVSDEQDNSINFRKLLVGRCQKEFEKNPVDEITRANILKEYEECSDPEKKKDLLVALEEEERRIRVKSVGNIRFIGELYKQRMLTTTIMHRCVNHLLDQNDEACLECLCKLLSTIGKDLESKTSGDEMHKYFNRMKEVIARKGPGKISSRIRFMLQDVIDLKANKWVPRRDDSNPKTIDEIQKEVESERLDSQFNNTPLNTPRKDDRNNDRKRNRGVGPTDESGWSQPVGRTRTPYSVETAKLKNKPPPMADLQLGSRNTYLWKTSTISSKTTNKFAYLDQMAPMEDKRMTPPQLSGSRSTGPGDYGRDCKQFYDGRSSHNGSHQLSSVSSNRDSSMLDSSQSHNASMPPQSLKSSASQSTSSVHKTLMSDEELRKLLKSMIKEYLKNPDIEKTAIEIQQTFHNQMSMFVVETVNNILEKSTVDRERVSRLFSYLISQKMLSINHFKAGFAEVLEIVDELIIDIPKIWTYLAEILSHPVEDEAIPLVELRPTFESLRSQGCVGKCLRELLAKIVRDKGPKWAADKWDQSGLQLSNLIDIGHEDPDKIIKDYNLEFITGDYTSAKSSASNQLTFQQIHDQLRRLMKENTFDEICSWIITNVGNQVKEPKFIQVLTTAILETSTEPINNRYNLNTETFVNLQQLIRRFVDANESLELQCLYAIQVYLHKLQHPSGFVCNIMGSLAEYNIISNDAFLTWKNTKDPPERDGHSIVTMALTSFFTELQEHDDTASVEDGSTGVNQDHC